jgi:hypothetical protein
VSSVLEALPLVPSASPLLPPFTARRFGAGKHGAGKRKAGVCTSALELDAAALGVDEGGGGHCFASPQDVRAFFQGQVRRVRANIVLLIFSNGKNL